jgi:phage tail tape-measure protein
LGGGKAWHTAAQGPPKSPAEAAGACGYSAAAGRARRRAPGAAGGSARQLVRAGAGRRPRPGPGARQALRPAWLADGSTGVRAAAAVAVNGRMPGARQASRERPSRLIFRAAGPAPAPARVDACEVARVARRLCPRCRRTAPG